MRILAIYRHYWPDAPPYARLLKAILEAQASAGHEVSALSAQPSYNDIKFAHQPWQETLQGVRVQRFALLPERKRFLLLRLLNLFYFLIRAIGHVIFHRRYDIIIANAYPPVFMGLALRAIKRLTRIPYILHCQDIHPESATLAGQVKSSWLTRLLCRIDTQNCQQAWRVVTLSNDMKQTLIKRDTTLAEKVVVLNNFSFNAGSNTALTNEVHRCFDNEFRVLFAGNIGRFQGLERLLEAVGQLGDELPLQLTFLGAGSEIERLKSLARKLNINRIQFEAYRSPEVATTWIQQADLGIVSLLPGVSQVAYPSKTMAYLAAGCPVLAIVESETQLASEIKGYEFGYVPAGNSVSDIVEALRVAWQDRMRWTSEARRKLATRSRQLFGQEQALQRWTDLFANFEARLSQTKALRPVACDQRAA